MLLRDKINNSNIIIIIAINLMIILEIALIGQCNFQFTWQRIYILRGVLFSTSIISIGSMYILYYTYKNDVIFLVAHAFILITIEYVYNNCFFEYIRKNYISIFLVLNFIFFVIDYLVFLYKDHKISRIILKQKVKYLYVTIGILLFVFLYEFSMNIFIGKIMAIKGGNMLQLIVAIFTIIVTLKIYKETFQGIGRNIYFFIALSLNIIAIKKLYVVKTQFSYDYASGINIILGILAVCVIIIGFFHETIQKINESEELKFNLNIFYKFVENNPDNNFVLLSDNGRVLYANELVRNRYCSENLSLEKQYSALEKSVNFAQFFNNNLILKELKNTGKYSGIVVDKINRYVKIEGRRIILPESYVDLYSYIDITEEYSANEKLRESEERLNTISENTLDFIVHIDKNGIIEYVNESSLKNIGCKLEDVLGKNYKELVVSCNENMVDEFKKCKEIKSTIVRNSISINNSKIIPLETIVRKVYDINGELRGYILVCRNVAITQKLNKITEKYNEIKEYNKIRTEFFANMSHELRTPINIIYSCIQLLNGKESDKNELNKYYHKYSKTIKQNCFRILRLVNNIIDVSKYDTKNTKLEFVNHDIVSLVEDITLSTVPYVEAKKLNITFDTSIEELEIKCNVENIERVILNLISNAIKFTKEGGSISVNIDYDKDYVYIRVKDTGIGIPEELKDMIFKRFVQTDKSLKRKKEGSGIGLALVKSIITLHNGEVYVESTSEKGSVFLIKLPNVILENQPVTDLNIKYENDNTEKADIEFSDIYD